MKELSPILRGLGLAESDIIVYLNTLQHGPSTVVDLAKRTKLSRQAVYLSIDAMTERGLMSSIQRGKKRFFTAEAPTKLVAHAKRQAQKVEERIGELEKLIPVIEMQIGGERPIVKLFEGREAVKAHLDEIGRIKQKEIYEVSDVDALLSVVEDKDLQGYKKSLSEQKHNIQGLYLYKNDTLKKTQRDHFPNSVDSFKSNITVVGDTSFFSSLGGKMHSISIEDARIANTLKILIDFAKKGIKK